MPQGVSDLNPRLLVHGLLHSHQTRHRRNERDDAEWLT